MIVTKYKKLQVLGCPCGYSKTKFHISSNGTSNNKTCKNLTIYYFNL